MSGVSKTLIGYIEDKMASEPTPYVIKRSPFHELAHMVALAESFVDRPAPRKTKAISCAWAEVQSEKYRTPKVLQEKKNKKAKHTARKKKRGY